MTDGHRVVVTGLGPVSSVGIGSEDFWSALLAGTSGVSEVRSFDTAGYPSTLGGEIHGFNPAPYISSERLERYGRASQLAIVAAALALDDAALAAAEVAGRRSAVFMGTTMGECVVQERVVRDWAADPPRSPPGEEIRKMPDALLAMNVGRHLGLAARCAVFPTACAAGNYALAHGFDEIRSGRADIVLAGGADAFSRMAFMGFARMLSLAPDCCRPFDLNRKGIVVGEGAGVLVLESLAAARCRGAAVRAEMLGYGLSCDAHHMTIPHEDGVKAVMASALEHASVEPFRVSLVCAHGTGTRMNDLTEASAVHSLFGHVAGGVPVVSIKSMLGHTMGAASALEAIACVLALRDSVAPPTINFATPDEECPVDCIPNQARELELDVVLNNSFAFGGNNATTVFTRGGLELGGSSYG